MVYESSNESSNYKEMRKIAGKLKRYKTSLENYQRKLLNLPKDNFFIKTGKKVPFIKKLVEKYEMNKPDKIKAALDKIESNLREYMDSAQNIMVYTGKVFKENDDTRKELEEKLYQMKEEDWDIKQIREEMGKFSGKLPNSNILDYFNIADEVMTEEQYKAKREAMLNAFKGLIETLRAENEYIGQIQRATADIYDTASILYFQFKEYRNSLELKLNVSDLFANTVIYSIKLEEGIPKLLEKATKIIETSIDGIKLITERGYLTNEKLAEEIKEFTNKVKEAVDNTYVSTEKGRVKQKTQRVKARVR